MNYIYTFKDLMVAKQPDVRFTSISLVVLRKGKLGVDILHMILKYVYIFTVNIPNTYSMWMVHLKASY